tara:strand:- start:8648 stop:11602 length:2955 start_codon:yes stop_codon:yes gene_type:complete
MGKVYTTQAGENLPQAVVEKLLATLPQNNPLAICDVTLYVPSPRAGLALKEAFLQKTGAGLLPRIHMMSFHDEDLDNHRFERDDLTALEVMPMLGRQMVLAQLVQQAYPDYSFQKCFEQGTALSGLFSKLKAYNLTLEDVAEHIPDTLSHHWQQNVEFFKIAFEFYPHWLAENHRVDGVDAAQQAVQVEIEKLQSQGMANLTWAVGFSDTTPLGLKLLAEIIRHNKGCLVLSALDKTMDDALFNSITETHPQFTLKRMLGKLNLERDDVLNLNQAETSPQNVCWQQALAPAQGLKKLPQDVALAGMAQTTLIETESESEEAETVALLMREALTEKGKTCALISPDRGLSLRVEAVLKRWGVNVDDSAGMPLLSTPLGQLFVWLVQLVDGHFSPLLFAEILHHKLVCLSDVEDLPQKLKALEAVVLRGERPAPGFVGLKRKLEKNRSDERLNPEDFSLAQSFLGELEGLFKPLMVQGARHTIDRWVHKHMQVLLALTKPHEGEFSAAFDEEAGQALLAMLSSWQDAAKDVSAINLETYITMLSGVMANTAVRKRQSTHPRLFILGPMESRLQHYDRVIVGAMNEGVWPRQPSADAWFNSAISEKLGLPSQNIHVGMSGHDLLNLVTGPEVFMTRTVKDSAGETMPSRFLSRLQSVLPDAVYQQLQQKGQLWKSRNQALRLQGDVQPPQAPMPKPAVQRRPRTWSASTARNMMQCPYKAYVHKVLHLEPLKHFEEAFQASSKGQLIHTVLESFFVEVPHMPPPYQSDKQNQTAVHQHLMRQAKAAFERVEEKASKALGLKQFDKIAQAFAKKLAEDDKQGQSMWLVEAVGRSTLPSGVELYAKADRLDVSSGGVTVIDYKTGAVPSKDDVQKGVEPQMAIEAVILKRGGFKKAQPLRGLEYWQVSGKKDHPIDFVSALSPKVDLDDFVAEAEQGLTEITTLMHQADQPYQAFPKGDAISNKAGPCKHCDYAGICRFKDWMGRGENT